MSARLLGSAFSRWRDLFSRRTVSLDGPPLFSRVPPWWARYTYALIACDLFMTVSAVELTWNHWSQLTEDLDKISKKNQEKTGSPSPSPSDNWAPRPLWQRAGLCIGHLGVGIGIAVALMVTQSRYVRTFTISPALMRNNATGKPVSNQSRDRQVLISCANNLWRNGRSFPLDRCSLGEGRDQTEIILRVDGERGHWYLSLQDSLINGKKASVVDAKRAILGEWDTGKRTGRWTPLPVGEGRWISGPAAKLHGGR